MPDDRFARTRAVSPRVQVVAHTGSTNADLVSAVAADPAAWPHLSVLLTHDQRSGRGRLDRVWTGAPGASLAASVVVRIAGIPPRARGWVPLIAGAAMTRAVAAQLPGHEHSAGLKWPNDVLVDGRKICGILAEVVVADRDAVVIGSGVNTRMTAAELPVTGATSFAALGVAVDEDRLLADYLVALDEQLSALARGGGRAADAGVRGEVEALCETLGVAVRVALPDGTALHGTAEHLDDAGRLVVHTAGGDVAVSAGDVVHVRGA